MKPTPHCNWQFLRFSVKTFSLSVLAGGPEKFFRLGPNPLSAPLKWIIDRCLLVNGVNVGVLKQYISKRDVVTGLCVVKMYHMPCVCKFIVSQFSVFCFLLQTVREHQEIWDLMCACTDTRCNHGFSCDMQVLQWEYQGTVQILVHSPFLIMWIVFNFLIHMLLSLWKLLAALCCTVILTCIALVSQTRNLFILVEHKLEMNVEYNKVFM